MRDTGVAAAARRDTRAAEVLLPTLVASPTRIAAAGTKPKWIDEVVGRVNTGTADVSVAHMSSPAGWVEPGQRPAFDETTYVLTGKVVVTFEGGELAVGPGQAVVCRAGEWVRYSTPVGAEYIAVCVPAFSPELVHRDPDLADTLTPTTETHGGDASRHLAPDPIDAIMAERPEQPKDVGVVRLLVARGPGETRHKPAEVELAVGAPFPGDRWDPAKDPDCACQITVMAWDPAERLANGQDMALFGDNLVVDLDLGADNLPHGTRLRAGGALLEVTAKPHTGCHKYAARFGIEALRWISAYPRRGLRLRGIHVRVLEGGRVAVGDPIRVLRPAG